MSVVLLGSTSGSVTLQEPAIAGSTVIDLPATSGTMAVLPTATSVLPEAQGGTGTTTGYYGFKNRIINGAMVIDQRNAGAVMTSNDNTYSLDRWKNIVTQNAKFTVQQTPSATESGYATRVNAGFSNYLAVTSSSAYSVLTGDYFCIRQPIEGFNIADLGWGTANAKTITLSFWVYSSLTGTFGGNLANSTVARSYPFSYTVSSANTWTQISITIAGDTSGTWSATNSASLLVSFGLGAGATYSGTANTWAGTYYNQPTSTVSVVGTDGATFYITGVQLEKGSTATSFDYRPYGTELALCQRYYYASASASVFQSGQAYASGSVDGMRVAYTWPVTMRASPTGSISGGSNGGSPSTIELLTSSTTSTIINLRNTGSGFSVWWQGATIVATAEL